MEIGIIGSGNVGITSAFAIAEKGSGHIVLWGRREGIAAGKALDLAEASPIRRYDTRIEGTDEFNRLLDSRVLVFAAGVARRPGMSRFDLLDDNLPIVQALGDRLRSLHRCDRKEDLPVVIMLTEPVDVMTLALQRRVGWPRERVLGVGGGLSAARLRHFISREVGIAATDIDAMVLGTHGEQMVILERYCRISGLPLDRFLERAQIDGLFERTRRAGTEIVEQAKRGSSFYTPGAAVADLVQAVVNDSNRVVSASIVLDGEYGVRGKAASVPVKVGSGGAKQVYQLDLTEGEKSAFVDSVNAQEPHTIRLESE